MGRRYIQKVGIGGVPIGLPEDVGWAGDSVQGDHYIIQDLNGNILGSFTGDDARRQMDARIEYIQYEYTQSQANNNGSGGSGSGGTGTETEAQRQERIRLEQAAKDEAKRLHDIVIGAGSLNDLEKALKELINRNKNYYGNKQRALRLGEGETAAKAYGGRYDVDINQNGTIEENERGYGNVAGEESVMGRAASSAANRMRQSGISDFNTVVENKNQRTESGINDALMAMMNANSSSLADLQNEQWGSEADAVARRDEARRKFESGLGTQYYQDYNGNWIVYNGTGSAGGGTGTGRTDTTGTTVPTVNTGRTSRSDPIPVPTGNIGNRVPIVETPRITSKPPDGADYTWRWDGRKWIKVQVTQSTTQLNNDGTGSVSF